MPHGCSHGFLNYFFPPKIGSLSLILAALNGAVWVGVKLSWWGSKAPSTHPLGGSAAGEPNPEEIGGKISHFPEQGWWPRRAASPRPGLGVQAGQSHPELGTRGEGTALPPLVSARGDAGTRQPGGGPRGGPGGGGRGGAAGGAGAGSPPRRAGAGPGGSGGAGRAAAAAARPRVPQGRLEPEASPRLLPSAEHPSPCSRAGTGTGITIGTGTGITIGTDTGISINSGTGVARHRHPHRPRHRQQHQHRHRRQHHLRCHHHHRPRHRHRDRRQHQLWPPLPCTQHLQPRTLARPPCSDSQQGFPVTPSDSSTDSQQEFPAGHRSGPEGTQTGRIPVPRGVPHPGTGQTRCQARLEGARVNMTEVEPVLDFASSGRTGRRNALPDILGSPAGVSPADLPLKLAEMSLSAGSAQDMQSPSAEVPPPQPPSPELKDTS